MNEVEYSITPLMESEAIPNRILEDFTVLIPTVGRPCLERCLQAVIRGTAWPFCILTIDQGNNTAVVADWVNQLKDQGMQMLHVISSQRSPASARNRGIEHVQTKFLAAIDDDCIAAPDWLEMMALRLRQNPAAVVTGRVNPGAEKENGRVVSTVTSDTFTIHRRPSLSGVAPLASGNMGLAVETTKRVGLFDEDSRFKAAAEDNEWSYRALRAGVPIIYAPDVIVTHLDWRDDFQLLKTYQAYAWGQGVFYGKYLRKADWFIALRTALYFYRGIKLYITGLTRNDFDQRVYGHARLTHFIPGVLAGLRAKR